jgi:alkylation response protein AidB-like acyl-CoA dehydrogenase
MIGFELSSEQKLWQGTARNFAEQEIKPVSWKIDRGLIHGYYWPVIEGMNKKGLLSMGVPKEYGGSGLDILTMAIVVEELAVGDGGIAFTATSNSYLPLMVAGTDDQKKAFLPLTANREKPGLAAFALTEPGAGSDGASISTSARRDGKEYILNGEKCFISSGDLASLYTVFCTVDKAGGIKGITAFLVPGDLKGVERGKIEEKMGFRSSHTGVVVFNHVRIDERNRLGEEGSGFRIAMKVLEVMRVISCGAVGVGLARAAYEASRKFLLSHSSPKAILNQQAISFDLADMLASIEACRLLVWKSAWMLDNLLPASTMSSMTKFYASDMAMEVTNKGLLLVGPHGYSEEYPLDKYVRDAKVLQIYEGTNQISRLVASRDIVSSRT